MSRRLRLLSFSVLLSGCSPGSIHIQLAMRHTPPRTQAGVHLGTGMVLKQLLSLEDGAECKFLQRGGAGVSGEREELGSPVLLEKIVRLLQLGSSVGSACGAACISKRSCGPALEALQSSLALHSLQHAGLPSTSRATGPGLLAALCPEAGCSPGPLPPAAPLSLAEVKCALLLKHLVLDNLWIIANSR